MRSSGSPRCPSTAAAPGRAVTSQGWLFAGTAELPNTQALTPDSDHAHSPLDPWDTCQWQLRWHEPPEVPQPVPGSVCVGFALEQGKTPGVGLPRNGEEALAPVSAEHSSPRLSVLCSLLLKMGGENHL